MCSEKRIWQILDLDINGCRKYSTISVLQQDIARNRSSTWFLQFREHVCLSVDFEGRVPLWLQPFLSELHTFQKMLNQTFKPWHPDLIGIESVTGRSTGKSRFLLEGNGHLLEAGLVFWSRDPVTQYVGRWDAMSMLTWSHQASKLAKKRPK